MYRAQGVEQISSAVSPPRPLGAINRPLLTPYDSRTNETMAASTGCPPSGKARIASLPVT